MSLCYVTAYLDIGRQYWDVFSRTFDYYFTAFKKLADIFLVMNPEDAKRYTLCVYIDEKEYERVKEYVGACKNIKLIKINFEFMGKNINVWKRLEREVEIMYSPEFMEMIVHRNQCPETRYAKYNLINHAKIDFINYTMTDNESEYFCWIDFGVFQNQDKFTNKLVDLNKIKKDIVNIVTVNHTRVPEKTTTYNDILQTLIVAPEIIGGYFFIGNRKAMKEYQSLYHYIHGCFQDFNVVDDDQHITLRCYYEKPELFHITYLEEWHTAMKYFS